MWISVTYVCFKYNWSTARFDLNSEMFVHPGQVCEWRSPEQLKELLDLDLREKGESVSKILQHCRDAIKYSVKTSKSLNINETDILYCYIIIFIYSGHAYNSKSSS